MFNTNSRLSQEDKYGDRSNGLLRAKTPALSWVLVAVEKKF